MLGWQVHNLTRLTSLQLSLDAMLGPDSTDLSAHIANRMCNLRALVIEDGSKVGVGGTCAPPPSALRLVH